MADYSGKRSRSRSNSIERYGNGRGRRDSPSYDAYDAKTRSRDSLRERDARMDRDGGRGKDRDRDSGRDFSFGQDRRGGGRTRVAELESRRIRRENLKASNFWPPSPPRPRSPSPEPIEQKRSKDKRPKYSETESSEDERRRRRKREKKDKKRRKRRHSSDSDLEAEERPRKKRSSSPVDVNEDNLDDWVEVPKYHPMDPPSLPVKASRHEDVEVGPLPPVSHETKTDPREYGGALLRGEGSAMAAFVVDGQRIPRRGEIGLTSDEIDRFENAGYVMSGSRHRRMNAVRLRKENQVITAEEKRGIIKLQAEENKKKEANIISGFRELVEQNLKDMGVSGE